MQIDPSIDPASHLLDPILYALMLFELCSAYLRSGGDCEEYWFNQALKLGQGDGPAHLAAGEAVHIFLPLQLALVIDREGMENRNVQSLKNLDGKIFASGMKDGLQIDDGIHSSCEVLFQHFAAGFGSQIFVSQSEAEGGQNINIPLQLPYEAVDYGQISICPVGAKEEDADAVLVIFSVPLQIVSHVRKGLTGIGMIEALPEAFQGRLIAIIKAQNLTANVANHISRVLFSTIDHVCVYGRYDLRRDARKRPECMIEAEGYDGYLFVDIPNDMVKEPVLLARMQEDCFGAVQRTDAILDVLIFEF